MNRTIHCFRLLALHKCFLQLFGILWCENGCLHCFLCRSLSCCFSGCSCLLCRCFLCRSLLSRRSCFGFSRCLYFLCWFCFYLYFCFFGICVCCTQDAVLTYLHDSLPPLPTLYILLHFCWISCILQPGCCYPETIPQNCLHGSHAQIHKYSPADAMFPLSV